MKPEQTCLELLYPNCQHLVKVPSAGEGMTQSLQTVEYHRVLRRNRHSRHDGQESTCVHIISERLAQSIYTVASDYMTSWRHKAVTRWLGLARLKLKNTRILS